MLSGDEGRVRVRIGIRPEPTADERDAVVAALIMHGWRTPPVASAPRSRWAMAARREQMRAPVPRDGDR